MLRLKAIRIYKTKIRIVKKSNLVSNHHINYRFWSKKNGIDKPRV
ncbi:hypothetical protein MARINOS108_11129 [Marinoscillum sp. 108]|nr:hypothetical protein MARINOS108_11129 [Marinoscillum sp. 108]